MRQRKCKVCGEKYTPTMPLQTACSLICAIEHGKVLAARKEYKETREKRKKLKSRAQYMKEAQSAFNKFIRVRDAHLPCISCGRHHQGQYHAGHYRTTKAAPELRFNEQNVHKQCRPCNEFLSGNIVNYRVELIRRIGIDSVEWIEGPHEPNKYTIEELIEIKKEYTRKAKELEKNEKA